MQLYVFQKVWKIALWLMFPPNPMYETNAIQLHFLLWFFWYISQWSGWISSIFCTRLYSKDIHCAFEVISDHLESWGNKISYTIDLQHSLFLWGCGDSATWKKILKIHLYNMTRAKWYCKSKVSSRLHFNMCS